MGQTLTHGVYLPSEGERNCYSGLASNWRLLNGAIGTVAAHTTAIAEKAPLVHTHGKADITDFPAYGTTAGTICEGNDSRLSDARTPVAHTHTKSDVTDLLNSNFIPSANNSYDLGSSSYQWNNLYAKNYFYNGTEFQSKFVTTDTVQTVNGVKTFTAYVKSIGSATGDEYSSNTRTNLWLMGNRDTQGVSGILFDTYRQNTAQGTGMHILGISIKENSVRYEGCRWGWYWDNNLNGYTFDFKPTTQGTNQALKHNLGTSVDKWDTLNGINPGALSLPDMDSIVSKSTELATAIDKTQTANSWTADFTGILRITWFVKNLTGPFRCVVSNNSDLRYATWGQTFSINDAWYFIVSFPVQNGKTYYFNNSFARTSEDTAPIIYGANAVYCLGNV